MHKKRNLVLNHSAKFKKLLQTPFKILSHNSGELALFLNQLSTQEGLAEELLHMQIQQFSAKSQVPQDTIL